MKLSVRASVAALTTVAAVAVGGVHSEAAPTLCVPVRATGVGEDLGDFHTVAEIFVLGVKVGSTSATFAPTGGTGSVVTFEGPITFTAGVPALGGFTVEAAGKVDISTGEFESEGDVDAGTGVFRGVTGHLAFTGTEDLSNATFTENISGRLCAARSGVSLFASH